MLSLLTALHAQRPGLPALPGTDGKSSSTGHAHLATDLLVSRTAGLEIIDGQVWGFSDSYKVRFDDDTIEFTPALGRGAPCNYPMTFRMDSIHRGGTRAMLQPVKPSHSELRAEYDHGAAVERYDLRPEAMEQSFVFARRPEGNGDLIVRGRLQTDMVVTAENGGLRLEQPGVGGFHIGAVTGIDAGGARAEGRVRYEDGIVEYSLPGAFVDAAALPLVLDPLVGSAFGVSTTAANERNPVAAYDVTNDCYLVVWQTAVSSTDSDIYGQRLSRAGALLGTRIAISVFPDDDSEPALTNVNGRNAFLVAFTRGASVFNGANVIGKAISASTGGVVVGLTIAGGTQDQHHPVLGGDSINAGVPSGSAVCVWRDELDDSLKSRRVSFNVDLTLALGTVNTLVQGPPLTSQARISKSGGSVLRHAVVFQRPFDTWAIIVNSAGAPLTTAIQLDSPNADSQHPSVDGDGTHWVVAWENLRLTVPAWDIAACSLSYASGPGLVTATAPTLITSPIGQTFEDLAPAAVTRTAGSTLIGWNNFHLGGLARSIDPFGCTACEDEFVLHGGNPQVVEVSGCSTASSSGGSPDEALLVWTTTSAGIGDIVASLWQSADGAVNSLGGGCGTGGSAQATCVRVPNPDFAHRLRGATPNAGTFLLQALGQETGVCGPCTRIPALSSAVVLFTLTDSAGNAVVQSQIPDIAALRGLTQFDQWLTLRAAGACTQFQIDMSNALRIVIE